MEGRIEALVVGPKAGEPLRCVSRVEAVAGRGLKGDRYYLGVGAFNRPPLDQGVREVTLIDADAVALCGERLGRVFTPEELRRNVVVSGMEVEKLVGRRFRVGSAVMRGVRTAPPCRYLSRLLGVDMMRGLKHLGGIRAVIETGGEIAVGDGVALLD
ncbi:MOSC domain-containing protein [Hydrogenimonas sp.]